MHRIATIPQDWSRDLSRGIGTGPWFGNLALLGIYVASPFVALSIIPVLADCVNAFLPQALATVAPPVGVSRKPDRKEFVRPPAGTENLIVPVGDAMSRDLETLGLGRTDAERSMALVASAVFPDVIRPGTNMVIELAAPGGDGRRKLASLQMRPRIDLAVAIAPRAGTLNLSVRTIAVDATPLRIRGTVGADLAASVLSAGLPDRSARQIMTAFDENLGARSVLRSDDSFDVVINRRRAADGVIEFGDPVFASIERNGAAIVQLLRWGSNDRMHAVGAKEPSGTERMAQAWPVAGHFTSGYGQRFHPILGYTRWHAGIDIGARSGTPIYAVRAGVVSFAGRHGGHGNYVRIDHGGGMATGYAHLSRIAVTPGMVLAAGQLIGNVGSTGLSTGPHLHYEVYQGPKTVDPLRARGLWSGATDRVAAAPLGTGIAALMALNPQFASPAN